MRLFKVISIVVDLLANSILSVPKQYPIVFLFGVSSLSFPRKRESQ